MGNILEEIKKGIACVARRGGVPEAVSQSAFCLPDVDCLRVLTARNHDDGLTLSEVLLKCLVILICGLRLTG